MGFKATLVRNDEISKGNHVLTFVRPEGLKFKPGQCIEVAVGGEKRDYSFCSSSKYGKHFQLLVRRIEGGVVSPLLCDSEPGDTIEFGSVNGFFTVDDLDLNKRHLIMVGTGTGVAPFLSLIKSYQYLNYFVLHGVRYYDESLHYMIMPENYMACVSTGTESYLGGEPFKPNIYDGRVTQFLPRLLTKGEDNWWQNEHAVYMLCGNSGMIDEVQELLLEAGVKEENIRKEVYF